MKKLREESAADPTTSTLRRRQFLGGMAGLGLAGWSGVSAQSTPSGSSGAGDVVIRNAYVITMDPTLGDLPRGDVHVRDSRIEAVGAGLQVPGAQEIDGEDMLVLPGLVETHWHVWTAVLRAMAGSKPGGGYFDLTGTFGKLFTPEDTYHSSRLGLAEAVFSGITYVHDWCHNVQSQEHAEASLRALRELGIRGRFSVGPASGQPSGSGIKLDVLQHLHTNLGTYSPEGRVSLGLAWPGLGDALDVRKQEIETARALKVPISVHAGRRARREDGISKLKDYFGPDLQIIHGITATQKELKALAVAGTSLSISPYSELRIGYGIPPVNAMLDSGIALGLSVDTTPLSGNADMFAVMKIFINLANALAKDEFVVSARRILALATLEGARSMGVSQQIGSLTPGKQADVIMVSKQALNLGVFTDPVAALVLAAQPANVDTVMVAGKVLKRHGKLTVVDSGEVIRQAQSTLKGLLQRSDW
ncbi:amidohydrolase family protein [Rhabdobacter roseus]|uniref:Cytosine/adenosine deaminase-related metal-dependent hydrolase n=1 Tax=Rhabdobacter roseus TaxID=1655419 RepID=A0A840TY76_9BACT|nr:amidohydrolase family protein [Rhabdobacter roseus]MBB5286517.1 cytosine/adenosine deaminase-related metal-dependent hydrolase [Rhabdobacter roseus]